MQRLPSYQHTLLETVASDYDRRIICILDWKTNSLLLKIDADREEANCAKKLIHLSESVISLVSPPYVLCLFISVLFCLLRVLIHCALTHVVHRPNTSLRLVQAKGEGIGSTFAGLLFDSNAVNKRVLHKLTSPRPKTTSCCTLKYLPPPASKFCKLLQAFYFSTN